VIVGIVKPSASVVLTLAAILFGLLGVYLIGGRLRPTAGRPVRHVAAVLIAVVVGHLVLIGISRYLKQLFRPIAPPLGITTQEYTVSRALARRLHLSQRKGLEITWMSEGGSAAAGGLIPTDVVLGLDGHPTGGPGDISRLLRREGVGVGSLISIRLLRGEQMAEARVRVRRADVLAVYRYHLLLLVALLASMIAWVLAFALLNRLPAGAKKRLVVAATFVAGVFYSTEYFLPAQSRLVWWRAHHTNPLSEWLGPWGTAAQVIAGFTIGLGVINLVLIHGKTIGRLRRGWPNSMAFFAALVAMLVFGIWQSYLPEAAKPDHLVRVVYNYLFDGFYVALGAAVFSVLAFYIATAAYRAFRIRTAEAGFMMAAAFIVMLGQIPLGMWLTGGIDRSSLFAPLRVENISGWILAVINMAGSRAILFGVAVGALAMSLRIWLNLERGAFFDQEI